MIPGGFSPTDRPIAERELPTGTPHRSRSSAKAAWLTLALIVLAIVAVVLLLGLMPEA
jgi:uncharacterized membrane protein